MKQYPIWKYHANGNDFILIETQNMENFDPQLFALSICERHFGIGADGLLIVDANQSSMEYYNQDGSKASMCGNGLRCCAYHFIKEHHYPNSFPIFTSDGAKQIQLTQSHPFSCKVQMGEVSYSPSKTKTAHNKIFQHAPFLYKNQTFYFYTLYMTTIHTVIFIDDFHQISCNSIGKQVCEHPYFLEGTNVNFVRILDASNIMIKTYERGVGMSNACGSGACASAYLAYHLKQCNSHINVHMDFGIQCIFIDDEDNISLEGTAICVMKGVYYG